MISYRIITKHTSDQKNKFNGNTDAKEMIFRRSVSSCQFKTGDRVKIRRSIRRGNVEDIILDSEQINWVGKIPHYLQVKFDDGVVMLCNPSQLKRCNN